MTDGTGDRDDQALIVAACEGYLEVVRRYLEIGVDVNAQEGTLLIQSAKYGSLSMVKYLVSMGAVRVGNSRTVAVIRYFP